MTCHRIIGFGLMALFYHSICWSAAITIEQPEPMEESLIVQPPKSDDLEFPPKQAKIVLYADDPDYEDKLNGYLNDNDQIIKNILAHALKITFIGAPMLINNKNQFDDELKLKGEPERIIFAFGSNATSYVLTRLSQLTDLGIINAVILFDPTIPSTKRFYGSELMPQYDYISNRVYNFYRTDDMGFWRKIFPARDKTMPAQRGDAYYFKGINILTQILDENGNKAAFDFASMDKDSFAKIIEVIAKTNKYRLQPDLEAIVKNNTLDCIRKASIYALRKCQNNLPIVCIHKRLILDESAKPPTISAEVIRIKGWDYVYNVNYNRSIPYDSVDDFRNTTINEEELSSYSQQILSMKEAKIEDQLGDFDMVLDNPFTHEKMGDQAFDQVQMKIKTYRLERDYIAKRADLIIDPALRKMCPGARHINIAIVASGGGSRAMFATYGVLKGLEELGVLGATSYICGLSGSTWAISSLFQQVNKIGGNTDIKEALKNASKDSAHQAHNFKFINEAILSVPKHYIERYPTTIKVKVLEKQPITNTDYYGCAIAEKLLGKGDLFKEPYYSPDYLSLQLGQSARWSRTKFHLPEKYTPLLPFPIYTAVMPLRNTDALVYPWFEFTPYQIGAVLGLGNNQVGMFVKTWAFGREFRYGRSIDFPPEQSLEFYLGIFGSAMNSTIRETVSMLPGSFKKAAMAAAYAASWVPGSGYVNIDYRWRFAEVLNPMYLINDSRFANYNKNKNLALIDAGIAFNLPFPPLNDYKKQRSHRKPDVIIFIDASADVEDVESANDYGQHTKQAWPDGSALQAVAEYAKTNEVDFPPIPPKPANLARKTCRFFTPIPGEEAPVVIYLPVTKDTTELNNRDLFLRVQRDNKVDDNVPIDLAAIQLKDYPTATTGLDAQHAVDLMALMEYNVLFNGEKIKRAICDRVLQQAPQPVAPAAPVPVAPAH